MSRIIFSSFYGKYWNIWEKKTMMWQYIDKKGIKENPEEKEAVKVHYREDIEIPATHANFDFRDFDKVSL